jgi:DNA primase
VTILVGTSGWHYASWKGPFFPPRLKLKDRLRKGRIFIDYLRNDETASAVTAYSVRARPGAPVSLPIDWKQLAKLESGDAFGMKEAVNRRGDPWRGMAQAANQSLPASDAIRGGSTP